MKRFLLFCVGLGLTVACGDDPEPSFTAPEITDVTVSAGPQRAEVTFRVSGGDASSCGVNLSEGVPGASVLRVEGTLNEGVAEVTLSRLTASTTYHFIPWADNGKFEIKGEEHSFTTEKLPEVRIFDFVCHKATSSSVSVSFKYTAPERVVAACVWCWPSTGGINDASARRIPAAVSMTGEISLSISGLDQNSTYCAQPFIYTEEGEIAGEIQQFSTIASGVEFSWVSISNDDFISHVILMSFGVKNHTKKNLSLFYFIQEGDQITYDENTFVVTSWPNCWVNSQSESLQQADYFFANSETRYTIKPFGRLSDSTEEYLGPSITFTTGSEDERCASHYLMGWNNTENAWMSWRFNSTYVPDPIFRQYLLDHFDTDHDGTLSINEANSVRHIDCQNLGIASLQGIERFQNIVSINCSGNPISEIDLTFNFSFGSTGSLSVCVRPMFLKEFIALEMNDADGNNVLKHVILGDGSANIKIPNDCLLELKNVR